MTSCADRDVALTLKDVESYISERPDSALAVLDSLSGTEIRSRKAGAKFALLYSMALDKNYIDVTEDSLLVPAIHWYRFHGSADEKLKTLYYRGRIYGNVGDVENEMKCYARAEKYVKNAKDFTASGMLYFYQKLNFKSHETLFTSNCFISFLVFRFRLLQLL